MSTREKLANIFIKAANWVDKESMYNEKVNHGLFRFLQRITKLGYTAAGFINGTKDYKKARIHHKLKTEWYSNIVKQAKLLQDIKSRNLDPDFKDFDGEISKATIQIMDDLGIDTVKLRVEVYLNQELDKLMELGHLDRLNAMRHLMGINLTASQHKLRIIN